MIAALEKAGVVFIAESGGRRARSEAPKGGATMRIDGNIGGCVLVLMGGVWALQGLYILGGSLMRGQFRWLLIGLAVAMTGVALLFRTNRQHRT
jgi:hypothetical protein